MRTKAQIEQLKRIPITHYLSEQGFQPVKTQGVELVYYSPKNEEHTPSFFVNPQKNVFHDYSGVGEQGDIIRLVQYVKDCSFMQAVETLEVIKPDATQSFSFSGQVSYQEKQSAVKIISVQPLRNRVLLAYVASRKISDHIAVTYLQEVHYQVGEKQYYAVGFGNDKGGYELRSQYFKGCTTPKWFTLITGQETNAVNVFEGVFDFLSCCEWFNVLKLKNPTIVLNSLSFLSNALPITSKFVTINAFFDNDHSGKRALERLIQAGVNVKDCSHYYPNSKDLNEHLLHHHIT
ncbi:CHC2 zinc finger domain-containing protein [Spirosoma sp. RP8]|uniref:CHC2 zinc finger domain-containing protein n=1 Tax=Spirosoma liriopis TaxID=2937440 RepID=A0ABT0HLV8_9BACT|nr:toprim domain-containing protein [Spirosoma liriopis]MCK8493157.1 CHC2 zinc finger domain-containing protein [Spirosoma liriopis]